MLADFPPSSNVERGERLGRRRHHQAGRGAATGERHLVDTGVAHERVARRRAADHDVQHSGRQPRLERELGEPKRTERRQLRGLDHDGVAGRQRGHRLLAHAHHRTVPRHDGADDPVGLGEHDVEDVARDRHDLAVELVDPARVVPGPGGGVLTRAHRAHRRAVVERVDRARLVVVRLEQVGEAVEDRHPLGHGDGPPLVPRSTRHRDRGVDLGRPGQRQLRLQHTGGGVVVLVDATRVARRPLPADHVAARRELLDQRGGGGRVERHQPAGRRRARRLATIGGA